MPGLTAAAVESGQPAPLLRRNHTVVPADDDFETFDSAIDETRDRGPGGPRRGPNLCSQTGLRGPISTRTDTIDPIYKYSGLMRIQHQNITSSMWI